MLNQLNPDEPMIFKPRIMMSKLLTFLLLLAGIPCLAVYSQNKEQQLWCEYSPQASTEVGKHIVLLAGDEEYRSEEAMPMLGKLLSQRHGFKCTVIFSVSDGLIDPDNQRNMPGLAALENADLVIMSLRFRNLPDEQMVHLDNYLQSGKPIIALRTSTHAFCITRDSESSFRHYSFDSRGKWKGGFGRQVLGDTWINHHGGHGVQSTGGVINETFAEHPVLQGVKNIWGPTDVYEIKNLGNDAKVLVHGAVLTGMNEGDEPVKGNLNDPMMPVAWLNEFNNESGTTNKIMCTTMGASVDLKNEGLRRLIVNSAFFLVGLEDRIRDDLNVSPVGEYEPTLFGFGSWVQGVRPADHNLTQAMIDQVANEAVTGDGDSENNRGQSTIPQEDSKAEIDKQVEVPARNKTVSPDSQQESLWTRPDGEDWPSFLGTNRDGKSNETGILRDWSDDNLKVVWQREMGEGYSNASISRGRALVADQLGKQLRLLCMNAETGAHLWEYRTECTYVDEYGYANGPRSVPVIDENRVYLHGPNGQLICVDFLTGKEVWNVDTFEQLDVAQNFFGVASTPIIEGDRLLVMIGGSTKESQEAYSRSSGDYKLLEPSGSCVVAFNKHTGSIIYKSGNHLCSWSSIQIATIDGRRWGFAFARHGLMGFNPVDGSEDFYIDWQPKNWKKTNIATPVVVNNKVLISESYGPGSLLLQVNNDKKEPKVIWQDGNRVRKKKLQTCIGTAIHLDGFLYGCSSDGPASGDFRCLSLKTGELIWKNRVLVGLGNAIYIDGHFIVTAEHGKLMLIKATPEKFELVTEYKAPNEEFAHRVRFSNPVWAAPVVSHGLLYIRDADNLFCFELKPSTLQTQTEAKTSGEPRKREGREN